MRRILGPALVILVAGCAKKVQAPTVQTAMVTRRDVIVDAQANGVIEPLVIVDVKSKAGGVITQMPVETGTHVNPGDLIVQIDTRDVQNKYNSAAAALSAAQKKLTLADADKKRNDDLFKARVITAQEHDQVAVNYETANANLVNAKANLDLAKQALDEATVHAPQEGTIITKNVAVGTVIASATGSVSGGTTIVQMADLSTVRIRALFNETDIGNVRPGEPANVTVDAYPDRRFGGSVEKIEPQAVIQQNVTMFPVLVNLQNAEGLLRPGMNGQVAVLIDERDNVLAIPNDAIKTLREAVTTGAMLGMSADSVTKELAAQGVTGGSRGGFQRGAGGGNGGNGGGRRNAGGNTGSANGDVALMDASVTQQGPGQGFGQNGGFGGMQVSDADCKKIDDAEKAHPAEKKQIDDLRVKLRGMMPAGFTGGGRRNNGGGDAANGGGAAGGNNGGFNRQRQPGDTTRRRGGNGGANGGSFQQGGGANGGGANAGGGQRGNPEMRAINDQLRALYEKIGVDSRTANACARRAQGGNAGQNAGGQRQANAQGSSLTPSTNEGMNRPVRQRQGLVFVSDSSKTQFHPRVVVLGQGNLDYTEVVSGLKEGERVVMLGALALQSQRLQQQDRARANAANPLGGQGPGGPGGGGRGGRGG